MTEVQMVRRYHARTYDGAVDYGYDSTRADRYYVDRKTGRYCCRYDLGDPADWHPEYGGASDFDRFADAGRDLYEMMSETDCVIGTDYCDTVDPDCILRRQPMKPVPSSS